MFERHASPRQIAANRLNAQKSTGPRSAEGKAVARMNALKTGIHAQSLIIYGEKAEDLETLAAEYYDHHQPATPQERLWLDILIRNEWLLRRLFAAEAQIWDHAYDRLCEPAKIPPSLGRIATAYDQPFERLQRRLNTTQRNCSRAMAELQRLQEPPLSERGPSDRATASEPRPLGSGLSGQLTHNESPTSRQIGFVPPLAPDRRESATDQPPTPGPRISASGFSPSTFLY